MLQQNSLNLCADFRITNEKGPWITLHLDWEPLKTVAGFKTRLHWKPACKRNQLDRIESHTKQQLHSPNCPSVLGIRPPRPAAQATCGSSSSSAISKKTTATLYMMMMMMMIKNSWCGPNKAAFVVVRWKTHRESWDVDTFFNVTTRFYVRQLINLVICFCGKNTDQFI